MTLIGESVDFMSDERLPKVLAVSFGVTFTDKNVIPRNTRMSGMKWRPPRKSSLTPKTIEALE